MKAAKIKLPQIITADDYHNFSVIEEQLNSVADIKMKAKEIGYGNGEYVGILYTGAKPKKEEIKKMLEEKGITLD